MGTENKKSNTNHEQWANEKEELLNEIADLKILYETIAEHSSTIESELEQKNEEVSALIGQLKKYLSPQLYQLIVGSQDDVAIDYSRTFLSIFFSDIVNFTEISDRTDPEVLSQILNEYLNEMAQIAIKYGGTIDKFIGDAIMVFFGAPEHIDDAKHAIDCCKMALEMQEKINELDLHWIRKGIPHGLKVRMGINSGYCTVGNFGSENRMDYTIIGGNVNIASRLESLAEPKSVFISSVTRNLLTDEFDVDFNQTSRVKGIHYPVDVFKLSGLKADNSSKKNPYFAIDENGLILKKINVDNTASAKDLKQIKDALKNALSFIEEKN